MISDSGLTRRGFVETVAGALLVSPRAIRAPAVRTLRVGLLLPLEDRQLSNSSRDISAGVALALTETERAGNLFGQRIEIAQHRLPLLPRSGGDIAATAVRGMVTANGTTVLLSGFSDAELRSITPTAAELGVVAFNLAANADNLRVAECNRRNIYHVAASKKMIADAEAAAAPNSSETTIELWHSSLERYGGTQLNDRYRARFNRPMSSAAWAGWVAVKIAWETSLRAQAVDPTTMLAVLGRTDTQFDGHKGAALSFRTWDNQLRQPLYAVAHDKVVAELPDVGRNADQAMREQLDRFGVTGTDRSRSCPEPQR